MRDTERILERIDALDGKIDGLDGRMDGLDGRMDGLDGRMDGLDGRMDGLDGRMDGLDDRLEGLGARVDALGESLDEFGLSLRRDVNDSLDHVATLVEQVVPALGALEHRLDSKFSRLTKGQELVLETLRGHTDQLELTRRRADDHAARISALESSGDAVG